MRSYRVHEFGAPESLVVDEIEDPVLGENQVLVDVMAVGLNFPDVLVVQGKYQILPPRPFTPGKDVAGIVRAVGPGALRLKPGDRVMGQVENGAFAERAVANASSCFVLPEALPFAEAAAMGLVYQTAWFALRERGRLQAGEAVLVGGAAGGVGLAAVQIAKGLGATVVAGVRGEEEARIARVSGADFVIDLAEGGLRETIRTQIAALNLPQGGVDLVIDPLGDAFFAGAIRSLAWRGRLVVIGFAAGAIPTLKVNYLLVKNISVLGVQWSDYRDKTPELVLEAQQELFDLWSKGAIRPHIGLQVPFEALPTALAKVGRGEVRGKAVVLVQEPAV